MKRIFDAIEKKVWIIVHLSSEVYCGLWSDIKAGQSLRTFNDIAQAHPHANDTHKSKMFSTLCLSFFRSPFINTLHICLLYRLLVAPARRWFWAFVRRVAWTKERSLCSVRITYIYKVDLCSCSYQCMANGVLSTFIHCSFQYLYVIRDLSLSLSTLDCCRNWTLSNGTDVYSGDLQNVSKWNGSSSIRLLLSRIFALILPYSAPYSWTMNELRGTSGPRMLEFADTYIVCWILYHCVCVCVMSATLCSELGPDKLFEQEWQEKKTSKSNNRVFEMADSSPGR